MISFGKIHWAYEFSHGNTPTGVTVDGHLNINASSVAGQYCSGLPDDLVITGSLLMSNNHNIKSLPNRLVVKESMYMVNSHITTIPTGTIVMGIVDATSSWLDEIQQGCYFGGTVMLSQSLISILPDNLYVGGSLYVSNAPDLKRWPKGMRVVDLLVVGKNTPVGNVKLPPCAVLGARPMRVEEIVDFS